MAFNLLVASGSKTGVTTKSVPEDSGPPPSALGSTVDVAPAPLLTTSVSTFNLAIFFDFIASLKLSTTVPPNSLAFSFMPSIAPIKLDFIAVPIPLKPLFILPISRVKIPIKIFPTPPKTPNAAFPNALKTVIIVFI